MRVKILPFGYSTAVQNVFRIANMCVFVCVCELNAVMSNVTRRRREGKSRAIQDHENERFCKIEREKDLLKKTSHHAGREIIESG